MKKLKKINLDQVKEFLFNHGEKVALGFCAFLALFFGGMELLSAMNAGREPKTGKTWTEELKSRYQQISAPMASLQAPPVDQETKNKLNPKIYGWEPKVLDFHPALYVGVEDRSPSTKRENPFALAIRNDKNTIQLDYVRSLVLMHENDPRERSVMGLVEAEGAIGPKGNAPGGPLAIFERKGEPRRMVVCTAVFPLKQQIEEFRRALKMKDQAELFANPDDLPQFLGINVVRYQIIDKNVLGKGEVLIAVGPDGKVAVGPDGKKKIMSESLEALLRTAIYDDNAALALEPYAFNGLMMPNPKLAYGSYPVIKLDGIKIALESVADKPGAMKPGMKGNNPTKDNGFIVGKKGFNPKKEKEKNKENDPNNFLANLKEVPIPWKALQKDNPALASRLSGEGYNPFHLLGLVPVDNQAKVPGANPPMQPMQPNKAPAAALDRFFDPWKVALNDDPDGKAAEPPQPQVGVNPVFKNWDRDALIRFIDPDVEPGKKYRYAIQVRIKNPNFGRKNDVAFNALAEVAELPPSPRGPADGWVTTPDIAIPPDYAVYAMDQQLLDSWVLEGIKAPQADPKAVKDHTAFQVHKWMPKYDDLAESFVIGDWAIAERLWIRKGEYIGYNADVRVPVWKKTKDAFELPQKIVNPFNPKGARLPGMKINLSPPVMGNDNNLENYPPLLVDFHGGKRMRGVQVEEESAVDALVMSADGRLMVFNSREDSDPSVGLGRERQERVDHSRRRVNDAKSHDR